LLYSISNYDKDYENDFVMRKVFLDNLFQKIDFKAEESKYLIIMFREVFAEEFSSTLTRYMKKTNDEISKIVYQRIEKIFSYQIFDSIIQIPDANYES